MVGDAALGSGLTVGSLLGMPLGTTASRPVAVVASPGPQPLPAGEAEGGGWSVAGGEVRVGEEREAFRPDGVEALDFNNPFGQVMERVWFDGRLVFAVDLGRVDVDRERVTVAQEYQVVYDVELDDQGKLTR